MVLNEAWILKTASVGKLEALELWLHTKNTKFPGTKHATNQLKDNRANCRRELTTINKCR